MSNVVTVVHTAPAAILYRLIAAGAATDLMEAAMVHERAHAGISDESTCSGEDCPALAGIESTEQRCAWCNEPFQMNGSFCSYDCENACEHARAELYPYLVDVLGRIAGLNPETLGSTYPEQSSRLAVTLGTAQGLAKAALDAAARLR
jgi:hypothetical protein